MAENTKIEWTGTPLPDGSVVPGHTFNPWIGCQPVSDGCANCYAKTQMTRKPRWSNCWGAPHQSERLKTSDAYWRKPLGWNKKAQSKGIRYKVFCGSLCDVFEDNLQVEIWRGELFRLIDHTPFLDWLILTKRPENIKKLWPFGWYDDLFTWPNIWMGTTLETQWYSDRLWHLSLVPSKVRWLSCEPLLGPLTLRPIDDAFHWVIVGGESGKDCRPMKELWARDILKQCRGEGIPFFMKQMGGYPNKRDKMSNFPDDLQVREFPR